MYPTLVPAKSRSGTTYLVLKSSLDRLMSTEKIHQLRRSAGWITIDTEQRKQETVSYTGPERRACQLVDFSLFSLPVEEQLRRTDSLEMILGYGERTRELLLETKAAAKTDLSVVIRGKTGTGKEILALMIHALSNRKDKPFIKVDCGAPPALIEQRLFGSKRGSVQGEPGRIRLAHGGTIFLDKIETLSLSLQRRLVGFLEERMVPSSDGARSVKVDVRIVSATTGNLMDQIWNDTFREDLYYRLNEFEIRMPSLRERVDDIPLLVEHFVRQLRERSGKQISCEARSGYFE